MELVNHPRGDERLAVEAAVAHGRVLEWLTIGWNSMEVFVTIGLGLAANSLALIAFGLDSLVEVFASLVVIWHMQDAPEAAAKARRRRALRLVALPLRCLACTCFSQVCGAWSATAEPRSRRCNRLPGCHGDRDVRVGQA